MSGMDLLFKLCTSILQGISSLLKVPELPVPLQHVLHVRVHDPDHLVHLRLLLGHLPGRLDLTDLGGPWYRLPIGTQGPGTVLIIDGTTKIWSVTKKGMKSDDERSGWY